ncbi:5'-3' exoribonuclease 4-like [Selaginella moellendorffii]|uniref:5'-3' exoribonuclease 4-like n=1 Tax=Selaginella moellendorffii TaxID=88036 RepID=UPI000D1C6FF2|nr:5'-3' exoribonuclease 4-like [Selaginella moellendorffii]|eukprot:XP_024543322.1 5'-3' exoribonuclease 4-like [Selaginella moellendorffii]
MGIPVYFASVLKEHPDCVCDANTGLLSTCANLYVDVGSAIFVILEREDCPATFAGFYREFVDSMHTILSIASPSKLVFLALDGRPPAAKTFHKIFKKSNGQGTVSKEEELDPSSVDDRFLPKKEKEKFAMVCHGTPFMDGVVRELRGLVARMSSAHPRMKWILSTTEEDGEGEHKIFKHIKTVPFNAHDTFCVVGRDADLIMHSLASPVSKKINILRQTPSKEGGMDYKILRIDKLIRDLEVEMKEPSKVRSRSAMRDFVFMCFFLGNDFLPNVGFSSVKDGVNILQATYKEVFSEIGEFLIDVEGQINMTVLESFVRKLSRRTTTRPAQDDCSSHEKNESFLALLNWCCNYYFNSSALPESYYRWETAPPLEEFAAFIANHQRGPQISPAAHVTLDLRPQWLKSYTFVTSRQT